MPKKIADIKTSHTSLLSYFIVFCLPKYPTPGHNNRQKTIGHTHSIEINIHVLRGTT
jgi:hypothetical protein